MWQALLAWLRWLRWWLTPDRVVALRVETWNVDDAWSYWPEWPEEFILRRDPMWTPVDQINVGDSCNLKVVGVKKSGRLVTLTPDQYVATDGTFVEIVGGVVTGLEEGLATITAALVANPAVSGQCTLAVADPIVSVVVETGNEVEDDPVEEVIVETGDGG